MEKVLGPQRHLGPPPASRETNDGLEVRLEQVVGKEAGDELASARDVTLREDDFDVVIDGMSGDIELGGDLFGGQASGNECDDFGLAIGQPIGLEQDGHKVTRPGGFDHDRDAPVGAE